MMNLTLQKTLGCRLKKILVWTLLLIAFLIPNLHAQTNCLGRTFTKLRANKPVTIAYFGGSITQGAGASNAGKTSYRALTTQWFRTTYPHATITEDDASIGGTGSQYGAFRCQRDVLSKNPDLVIVEFAVNDINNTDFQINRQMEGIVRQIYTANPQTEILFVYTCNKVMGDTYTAGTPPHTVVADTAIANAYGIGQVNMGKDLWQKINDGKESWTSLTVDGVHPNDAGYKIYYDSLVAFLTEHQNDTEEPTVTTFPSGLSTNPITGGKALNVVTDLPVPPDWMVRPVKYFHQPTVLFNETVGATYTYSFTGTDIGILVQWAPDGANLSYSLDGAPFQKTWSMSDGAKGNRRENTISFGENLPDKSHTLVLRIDPAGGSLATGTSMYLAAMLVFGTTNTNSNSNSAAKP